MRDMIPGARSQATISQSDTETIRKKEKGKSPETKCR